MLDVEISTRPSNRGNAGGSDIISRPASLARRGVGRSERAVVWRLENESRDHQQDVEITRTGKSIEDGPMCNPPSVMCPSSWRR